MGKTKICAFGNCKNDSRRLKGKDIRFIPFPKPKTNLAKCKDWVEKCGRLDDFSVNSIKQSTFVCSLHFIGGQGPTKDYPDIVDHRESQDFKIFKNQYDYYQELHSNQSIASKIKNNDQTSEASLPLMTNTSESFLLEASVPLHTLSSTSEKPLTPIPDLLVDSGIQSMYFELEELKESKSILPENMVLPSGSCTISCSVETWESNSTETWESNSTETCASNSMETLPSNLLETFASYPVEDFPPTQLDYTISFHNFIFELSKFIPKEWAITYLESDREVNFLKYCKMNSSITIFISIIINPEKTSKERIIMKVLNRFLPQEHLAVVTFGEYFEDLENLNLLGIINALSKLNDYGICQGVKETHLKEIFESTKQKTAYFSWHDSAIHSNLCDYLIYATICERCKTLKVTLKKRLHRQIIRERAVNKSNGGEKKINNHK